MNRWIFEQRSLQFVDALLDLLNGPGKLRQVYAGYYKRLKLFWLWGCHTCLLELVVLRLSL